jgi:hypothetical protein
VLTSPYLYVGLNGSGVFNQSGGTCTSNTEIDIADLNDVSGTCTITGGSLSAFRIYVGGGNSGASGGFGALNISGGTVTVSDFLTIYQGAAANSVMLHGGGSLAVANAITVGSGASLTLGGGSLTAASLQLAGTLNTTSASTLPPSVNVNLTQSGATMAARGAEAESSPP